MLHKDTFPLASQLSYAEGKPTVDETPEPQFPASTRERFVKTEKACGGFCLALLTMKKDSHSLTEKASFQYWNWEGNTESQGTQGTVGPFLLTFSLFLCVCHIRDVVLTSCYLFTALSSWTSFFLSYAPGIREWGGWGGGRGRQEAKYSQKMCFI